MYRLGLKFHNINVWCSLMYDACLTFYGQGWFVGYVYGWCAIILELLKIGIILYL